MKLRNFRIAWSVAWGVVAVLLVVLWVRSFWTRDHAWVVIRSKFQATVETVAGNVYIAYGIGASGGEIGPRRAWTSRPRKSDEYIYAPYVGELRLSSIFVQLPLWSIVALAALIGSIPWLRWRFSVRTLLIVTAVVAVGLGLLVYDARQ
jgi:hypothetical protein